MSKELSENPDFEAISVRRMGRSMEAIKWQLTFSKYQEIKDQFKTVSMPLAPVFELPAGQTEYYEIDAHVSRKDIANPQPSSAQEEPESIPEKGDATLINNHIPYSWGLGHLSNSLYESQFPLSLGGVGSSLASGYSILGTIPTTKGKGKIFEPYDPSLHTSADDIFYSAPEEANEQSTSGQRQNVSNPGSGNGSSQPSRSTEVVEDHAIGRNEDDGNEDQDEDGHNRKRKRFKTVEGDQERRRFVCPYHLHDPSTYGISERTYERCALTRFQYVSELK